MPIFLKSAFAALLGLALSTVGAHARQSEIYTGLLSSLAVGGYDTVAYFKQGRPVVGKAEFSTQYKGATWRFASQENLEAFRASPTAYAPQYGGYCAWAVAHNYTASGDPLAWSIAGGKLYLNYDQNVRAMWLKNVPGFIASAERNWPRVLDK